MPHNFDFVFPLPNGLHARPASHLEAIAARFSSSIAIRCGRNGNEADVHSVLSMIAADIRGGDECRLTVEGGDQAAAFETLVLYLNHEFPHCDEALPAVAESSAKLATPNFLAGLRLKTWWSGIAVCEGLAIAPLVCMNGLTLAGGFSWPVPRTPGEELATLASAVELAKADLAREIGGTSGLSAEILTAQAKMLSDKAFVSGVSEHLDTRGGTAGEAVLAVTANLAGRLLVGSKYLQERVGDLHDVASRVLVKLYGRHAVSEVPVLKRRSIVCGVDLTPGQFLALDLKHVAGVVLENGGATSHTSILARAAGIPLVIAVAGIAILQDGMEAILDARRGILVVEPEEDARRFYQREADRWRVGAETALLTKDDPAESADGHAMEMHANVSTASDVQKAVEHGAQGIGLFRTELIYMNRAAAPDEEEQLEIYQCALRYASGRPLVFRTFDIGGDKPISYLDLPVETNPFLGLRGVRLYDRFPDLIRTQLRALLRASATGPVKIMVPMIASSAEMRGFRALVDEVRLSLKSAGKDMAAVVPVGAMLEIPSAIFDLAEISRHADFFSVGSNDLVQYFLAADRDNPSTASLGTWRHPAFLRLLQMAVSSARRAGKPIGLCGDLASRPEALPLLFGLGFDSISMGGAGIPRMKSSFSRMTRPAAARRLEKALSASDDAAVETLLSSSLEVEGEADLLTTDLLRRDSSASSKAEIINELVSMVEAGGRTGNGIALEEALWTRESAYATNFGYGFAVPHCQTAHVPAPVIAVLHVSETVKWNDSGEDPVKIAILLAMPAGENRAHLQIFARLSRLIMREEFRDALVTAADSREMLDVLTEALQPVMGTAA